MTDLLLQAYIQNADAFHDVHEIADALMAGIDSQLTGEVVAPIKVSVEITALGDQYPMGSDIIASRIFKGAEE